MEEEIIVILLPKPPPVDPDAVNPDKFDTSQFPATVKGYTDAIDVLVKMRAKLTPKVDEE